MPQVCQQVIYEINQCVTYTDLTFVISYFIFVFYFTLCLQILFLQKLISQIYMLWSHSASWSSEHTEPTVLLAYDLAASV